MTQTLRYRPEFFDPKDLDDAKWIILGLEGEDLDQRWAAETQWQRDLFRSFRCFGPDSVVLDLGTGIGRIARLLIEEFGCTVYGCDISQGMLDLAVDHVASDRFIPIHYDDLLRDDLRGKFTHVVSIWTLQHAQSPEEAVFRVLRVSDPDARFFVCELSVTSTPCWNEDGSTGFISHGGATNRMLLERFYDPVVLGQVPEDLFPKRSDVIDLSWWALLKLRKVRPPEDSV